MAGIQLSEISETQSGRADGTDHHQHSEAKVTRAILVAFGIDKTFCGIMAIGRQRSDSVHHHQREETVERFKSEFLRLRAKKQGNSLFELIFSE